MLIYIPPNKLQLQNMIKKYVKTFKEYVQRERNCFSNIPSLHDKKMVTMITLVTIVRAHDKHHFFKQILSKKSLL